MTIFDLSYILDKKQTGFTFHLIGYTRSGCSMPSWSGWFTDARMWMEGASGAAGKLSIDVILIACND
jgi:hypothetical protein